MTSRSCSTRAACCRAGQPEDVFRKPASPYVAEFLGAENVFAGTARVLPDDSPDWQPGASPAVGRRASRGRVPHGRADDLRRRERRSRTPGYAVIRAEEILLSLEPQEPRRRAIIFAGGSRRSRRLVR